MGASIGAAGKLELWVDDQAVVGSKTPINTLAAGGYSSISVGALDLHSQDPAPTVIWIDDVALGTQRIGCGGS